MAQSGGGDIAAALQQLDFLPESPAHLLPPTRCRPPEINCPKSFTALLEPLFLPLVQVVLFVLLCLIVRWVFALLVRLLRGVNALPLLGGANRLLGFVWALSPARWTAGLWRWPSGLRPASPQAVRLADPRRAAASIGYSFFGAFNPFLVHY